MSVEMKTGLGSPKWAVRMLYTSVYTSIHHGNIDMQVKMQQILVKNEDTGWRRQGGLYTVDIWVGM